MTLISYSDRKQQISMEKSKFCGFTYQLHLIDWKVYIYTLNHMIKGVFPPITDFMFPFECLLSDKDKISQFQPGASNFQ